MNIRLHIQACTQGRCLPLLPAPTQGAGCTGGHGLLAPEPWALPRLDVGTNLCGACGTALFKVTAGPGCRRLPPKASTPSMPFCSRPWSTFPKVRWSSPPGKEGLSLAWVTLSDRGARGQRTDLSGPAIAVAVGAALPLCHCQGFLLPDEPQELRALLTDLALNQGYDLICTTGGTGLSPRDTTPQVTAALLDMPLPGFTQAMLAASLAKTPHAVISRAAAGALGRSIVINLPGSRKAVVENLAAVLPALPHALAKLQGDAADCGG